MSQVRALRAASFGSLLSLGAVRPLLGAMGLSDDGALVDAARDAIVAFRARAAAQPEVPLDFADALLGRVAAALGDEQARALDRWSRHTYHEAHADLPDWSAWRIAFFEAAHGAREALRLPRDRRAALLERCAELDDVGELEAQMQSLARVVSDWDVEIYVRRNWDPDDPHAAPFGVVREVARMHRFQLFARELASQLAPGEMARLQLSAARLVERRRLWMPGPLAPLTALLEAA